MDLASLFCMIGRHGPAVALTVVALLSVLAAFIIYRTVRGKRRKAAVAAAGGGPGAESEAPMSRAGREPSPEDAFSSADSTGKRLRDKLEPADRCSSYCIRSLSPGLW